MIYLMKKLRNRIHRREIPPPPVEMEAGQEGMEPTPPRLRGEFDMRMEINPMGDWERIEAGFGRHSGIVLNVSQATKDGCSYAPKVVKWTSVRFNFFTPEEAELLAEFLKRGAGLMRAARL